MAHHCLYRMLSGEGRLLYVGMTMNPSVRLRDHRLQQPRWSEVAQILIEHFGTHEELSAAERTAIASENPAWNVVRYVRGPRAARVGKWRRRYQPRSTPAAAEDVA